MNDWSRRAIRASMMKRIVILGSTGSIGTGALKAIEGLGDDCRVVGLAAHKRWELLVEQARRFRPAAVAIADESLRANVAEALSGEGIEVHGGADGLVELVQRDDCDFVLAAVVGAAGLRPTLAAVERGLHVGLANKEPFVMAGGLFMAAAERSGATIIPVDSEHSAIFQSLQAGRRSEVRKIILTASGGPFRTWSAERMADATVADALNHPTWSMGPKITVDSATMMNKALEIVEARWLFDIEASRIEVLIHPQSVVHSMVEYCDGSVVAQLGTADMCTPIQYAITYPDRRETPVPPLDLAAVGVLDFQRPDFSRFPALGCGYEVARRGGTAGAVYNAANEVANEAFRAGALRFGRIVELSRRALERHEWIAEPTLDELLDADRWARAEVRECLNC